MSSKPQDYCDDPKTWLQTTQDHSALMQHTRVDKCGLLLLFFANEESFDFHKKIAKDEIKYRMPSRC